MPEPDFGNEIEKETTIEILNPASGNRMKIVTAGGSIMKACVNSAVKEKTPLFFSKEALEATRQYTTLTFDGDLLWKESDKSYEVRIRPNPVILSEGQERPLHPDVPYPAIQEWHTYVIFEVDMSWLPSASQKRVFLGNRPETPIRLQATLNGPWGESLPLKYDVIDECIPLWPWDQYELQFSTVCPITGSEAHPLANILSSVVNEDGLKLAGDKTLMKRAWKRSASGKIEKFGE